MSSCIDIRGLENCCNEDHGVSAHSNNGLGLNNHRINFRGVDSSEFIVTPAAPLASATTLCAIRVYPTVDAGAEVVPFLVVPSAATLDAVAHAAAVPPQTIILRLLTLLALRDATTPDVAARAGEYSCT